MLNFLKAIFNPKAEPGEQTNSGPTPQPLPVMEGSGHSTTDSPNENVTEVPNENSNKLSIDNPDNGVSTPLPAGRGKGVGPDGSGANDLDTQYAIVNAILSALHPFRGTSRFKGITLWAADSMYDALLHDEAFEKLLRSELENQLFTSLSGGTIEVKTEQPAEGAVCAVAEKVFFAFNDGKNVRPQSHLLKLKAMPGMGSLVQPEYILDSAKETTFYVGRGEVCQRNGRFLQNDVAIREDDPNAETQAQNNQVSHSHAKIVFSEGNFYLQALPSGCRSEGGSPTKVAHGRGEPVEIRDIHSRFPLASGDYILLGKAVCLKVELQ